MSVSVRAGTLRHRVTIQQQATTRNDYGEKANTWTDLATVNASVRPMYGREFIEARIAQSEITHKVVMRYYPDITAKRHRLVHDSRVLNIESLMNIEERNVLLEILCVETDIAT